MFIGGAFRRLSPGPIQRTAAGNNQQQVSASAQQRTLEVVMSVKVSAFVRDGCRQFFRAKRFQNVFGNKQARSECAHHGDDRKWIIDAKRGNTRPVESYLNRTGKPLPQQTPRREP